MGSGVKTHPNYKLITKLKKHKTMFKFIKKLLKNDQVPQCDKIAVRECCIDFSTWIQDNYSPNKKQGGIYPLPKGKYRKDFTDEIYTISQLYDIFNAL